MQFDPSDMSGPEEEEDPMLNTQTPPRAAALRPPLLTKPAAASAPALPAALKQAAADPLSGGWYDSSMELQRGLFVQDLCVESADTEWLALFDDGETPKPDA